MTQQQSLSTNSRHPSPPDHTPRLRLKPKAPRTGYVDGAWWPWSDDLESELPDLLAVLSVRLGPVQRVMYNLGEWAVAPRKAQVGDRVVRLDGYRRQPVNTLEVLGATGARILLLVVPPGTDSKQARATMMAAAAPSNDAAVTGLLTAGAAEGAGHRD